MNVGDSFQLNPEVFSELSTAVGGLSIDRFATQQNALLPIYNTYFLESEG